MVPEEQRWKEGESRKVERRDNQETHKKLLGVI